MFRRDTFSVSRPSARLRLFAIGMAMVTSLTGCGLLGGESGNDSGPTDKVEKSTIRLGLLPVVDVASVHLAIKEGYFKAEGLNVELVAIQSSATAIPQLISPNPPYDVVFGNYLSFFAAEAAGTAKGVEGLKFIADGYFAKPNTWMVLAGPNSPVKSPKDLPGRKVGVTAKNSLAEVSIRSYLRANDVDANSIQFVELGYAAMGPQLKSGGIDAALMAEPFITEAEKNVGAVPILDAASGPTADLPIAGYGTTGKFARENPKTVAAFQRAFAKGQEAAGADRSKVEALLPDYAKMDKQVASLVTLGGFPTSMDPVRLQRIPDLMLEFGVIKQRFDAKTMILGGAPQGG